MNGSSNAVAGVPIETPSPPGVASSPRKEVCSRFEFRQSAPDRSLDQWRGLALVFVLISHGFHETGRVPGIGRAGVNLFFFISGILVYRSLSRGPQTFLTGAKWFWIRRTKRLVPAKYFYLLCISLVVLFLPWPTITPDFQRSFFAGLPSALLYYRNYYVGP